MPFPFTRLTAQLEGYLPAGRYGYGALKRVLIPLGRSLQRNAAAPEFFRSPRVVVAVDTEPLSERDPPYFLKDRLFLGYQERAKSIEVISFNDSAGRFEFQVVTGYEAGATPEVRYARRALCTSCHQNGGPIFSEAGWDETNRSLATARRLEAIGKVFHGVAVNANGAVPASVDNATDRANRIPVIQLLWERGCAAQGVSAGDARRCRAGALIAALQYRLSALSHYDRSAVSFTNYVAATLDDAWRRQWPDGLAVPGADIPNRVPLLTADPRAVPGNLDPLNRRAPEAVWLPGDRRNTRRFVTGLGEMLPHLDTARLDEFLFSAAHQPAVRVTDVELSCRIRVMPTPGTAIRLVLRCSGGGTVDAMDGEIRLGGESKGVGRLDRVTFADGNWFSQLEVHADDFDTRAGRRAVRFRVAYRQNPLHVRLADGSAIESIRIEWPDSAAGVVAGRATFRIRHDFALVRTAVEGMIAKSETATALDDPRLRPTALMQDLFTGLGLAPTPWCCDERRRFPEPVAATQSGFADTEPEAALDRSRSLRTFRRYCGGCHRSDTVSPPGFLCGSGAQASRRLERCAPRIYYRLSMWRIAASARGKSPMPPPTSVANRPASDPDWVDSRALKELRARALELAGSDPGESGPKLLSVPYESLRTCLPG